MTEDSQRISIAKGVHKMVAALTDYAMELTSRMGLELKSNSGFDSGRRGIELEDLSGAIQMIRAQAHSLRDVDRLNRLSEMGAVWLVKVNGEIIGSGSIRTAIDQAIEKEDTND